MIKQAVILAAGKGLRMKRGQTDPEILSTPKPLLKVNGVPIIEKTIKKLSEKGLRIIVVINPLEEVKFQETLSKYGVSFCYQPEPLGTAHALYSAKDLVEEDLFLVLMGDDITEFDLEDAIMIEEPSIFGFEVKDLSQYGAIMVDKEGIASSIREKEIEGPGTVNTGVYLMPKEFFNLFKEIPKNGKSGEYYLTEAIPLLYKTGKGLRLLKLNRWKGINKIEDLNQANGA
jgi:NDP-sugar pyrophosphorylase family protein